MDFDVLLLTKRGNLPGRERQKSFLPFYRGSGYQTQKFPSEIIIGTGVIIIGVGAIIIGVVFFS
jgi:hypothetical protein